MARRPLGRTHFAGYGLQASLIGTPDAGLAMIVDSYFDHWGAHASQALNAIDAYYRKTER